MTLPSKAMAQEQPALCVSPDSYAARYGKMMAKVGLPKLGFRTEPTAAGPAGQYAVPPVLALSSTHCVRFPSPYAKEDILEQNADALKVLLLTTSTSPLSVLYPCAALCRPDCRVEGLGFACGV